MEALRGTSAAVEASASVLRSSTQAAYRKINSCTTSNQSVMSTKRTGKSNSCLRPEVRVVKPERKGFYRNCQKHLYLQENSMWAGFFCH